MNPNNVFLSNFTLLLLIVSSYCLGEKFLFDFEQVNNSI